MRKKSVVIRPMWCVSCDGSQYYQETETALEAAECVADETFGVSLEELLDSSSVYVFKVPEKVLEIKKVKPVTPTFYTEEVGSDELVN